MSLTDQGTLPPCLLYAFTVRYWQRTVVRCTLCLKNALANKAPTSCNSSKAPVSPEPKAERKKAKTCELKGVI